MHGHVDLDRALGLDAPSMPQRPAGRIDPLTERPRRTDSRWRRSSSRRERRRTSPAGSERGPRRARRRARPRDRGRGRCPRAALRGGVRRPASPRPPTRPRRRARRSPRAPPDPRRGPSRPRHVLLGRRVEASARALGDVDHREARVGEDPLGESRRALRARRRLAARPRSIEVRTPGPWIRSRARTSPAGPGEPRASARRRSTVAVARNATRPSRRASVGSSGAREVIA